jgi:hypothetical protein
VSKSIYAKRRASVQTACDKIIAAQPLADGDRQSAWGILSMILRGDDARKYLGIKPSRRASTAAQQRQLLRLWLPVHYWMLRESEKKDDPALKAVAEKWGISANRVFVIAHENPKGAKRTLKALERKHLLKIIEMQSARYRDSFAKSRK